MVSPETLRSFRLFAGQSNYMLDEMAMLASEVELEAGEWLFHEQEDAMNLYLILEGSVSLCLNIFLNEQTEHLEAASPLGEREMIGWSAVVKPHIYTFGARAEQNSKLIAFAAEPLRELLDDNPGFGYYLIKNVSEVIGDRLTCKIVQLFSLVLNSEGEPILAKP